ncbi:LysR family transcriptional regulator [Neisseria animaloris]|uniref:LysR family transcriptional regulator n=1 Tax=Neisseria animaloris TaxID=326522 RepID=A0A448UBF1_9NEIS|nr:LysR family transcriptional regulator [Neisseria animaloris]VEJ21204.1 LysR family transcriptional regulator [Neisseria animaloris]
MDTFLSMKVFRQVIENGSFTKAAERMDLSPAMVSKHVRHLESSIGAKLLLRNTRSLSLTEAGAEYYRQCAYALDTLDQAAQKAASGVEQAQGLLRLTAPVWFASSQFAQWLTEYSEQYPDITLEVVLDNRHKDLVGDGFDLALRASDEPAPSLIVRRLGTVNMLLCASATFIERYGLPETLEQAAASPAVLPGYVDMRVRTLRHLKSGESEELRLKPVFTSNNSVMVYQMILAGRGIGYGPDCLICDDLAKGRLVRLLPDYSMPSHPLYAAYADRQYLSAKVRSFIDFISGKLGQPNPFLR